MDNTTMINVMRNPLYTWEFGPSRLVRIFKEGTVSNIVAAEYDNKFRFKILYSTSSNINWSQVITCLAEAKSVLKKINKI